MTDAEKLRIAAAKAASGMSFVSDMLTKRVEELVAENERLLAAIRGVNAGNGPQVCWNGSYRHGDRAATYCVFCRKDYVGERLESHASDCIWLQAKE